MSTRYAVVMAVTVSEPKPFMKLCSIRLPAALMLCCIMGGRPKAKPSRMRAESSRLGREKRSKGCFFAA